jgi:vacuolar-type H+-ATPase subunit H
MADALPAPTDAASIEVLKRVKAAETDWASRRSSAQAEQDATLARLRDETEAAVKAAQAEADQERTRAVQSARDVADREAAAIVAQGQVAATAAAAGQGKRPADRKDAILAAVLGEFARD